MVKPLIPIVCLALLTVPTSRASAGLDMSSLWPNDDGRAWTYQSRYENFDGGHTINDQVVRLLFDGPTVAPAAVAAQVLREQLISGSVPKLKSAPGATNPLLANLWLARPDLRAAILQRSLANTGNGNPCPENAPAGGQPALLLSGELAYVKTANDIGSWRCNAVDTQGWLWLVSNLTLGNTFVLQLVPDLADNVYLHGTIGATESVSVPAGTFAACLRVDYVIDYGTVECVDTGGNPVGTYHSETRGSVHYAPGVGPVQSYEELIPTAATTGACDSPWNVGEAAFNVSRKLDSQPVPVVATTWGRIKAIYR